VASNLLSTGKVQANVVIMLKNENFISNLNLSNTQIQQLNQILRIEANQANLDRQNFGFSQTAMTDANSRRMKMIESMFTDILNKEQLSKYNERKMEWVIGYDNLSFRKLMKFNKQQASEIDNIIINYEKRESFEKEKYKDNAKKLIQAASDRKFFLDREVEKLLTDKQKQEYTAIKRKRDSDIEFFRLKEGLLLNKEQMFAVKNILNSFNSNRKLQQNNNSKTKMKGRKQGKGNIKYSQIKEILKPFQIKLLNQLSNNNNKKQASGKKQGMGKKRGGRQMF
jgi:hypothetical protein